MPFRISFCLRRFKEFNLKEREGMMGSSQRIDQGHLLANRRSGSLFGSDADPDILSGMLHAEFRSNRCGKLGHHVEEIYLFNSSFATLSSCAVKNDELLHCNCNDCANDLKNLSQ